MEFKTAEEKLLHDYAVLEEENELLRGRVAELESQVDGLAEDRACMEVDRDHHADCVKDMLALAKWYGFDQPKAVAMNPMGGLTVREGGE